MAVPGSDGGQAFQDMRLSGALHRAAFFDHGVVKILADPETGVIVEVNQAACDFYGYTRDELIGSSVGLFALLPHDKILSTMELARYRKRNRFESLHQLASGDIREVELHPYPTRIDGRDLLAADIFDVTPLRTVERELADTRRRLDMALVAGEVGVWELDLVTGSIWHSSVHDRLFGYAERVADWNYERFLEHVLPEARERVNRGLDDLLKNGASGRFEFPIRRSDGAIRHVEIAPSLRRDERGKPVMVVGTIRDITEQKMSEERLQAAKATAEEAVWLKDRFLSLMAHDLRNPIYSMLNLLRLLATDGARGEASRTELLGKAMASGERTLMTLEDLLAIARFKTGSFVADMAPVSLGAIGEEAVSLVRDAARRKGVETLNRLSPYATVVADKTMLSMVLQNLLANAVKFCKAGDRITLSQLPGCPERIMVCDSGVGMPDELVDKLFTYGGVVSSRGTDGEQGTGLGLPLCADMMRLMGGELNVASIEGTGTLIALVFSSRIGAPVVPATEETAAKRDALRSGSPRQEGGASRRGGFIRREVM